MDSGRGKNLVDRTPWEVNSHGVRSFRVIGQTELVHSFGKHICVTKNAGGINESQALKRKILRIFRLIAGGESKSSQGNFWTQAEAKI